MAEENKHPPTTEEQAPPEMPGKAPKMEQAEWKLLPEAVRLFCEGRLRVEGRTVIIEQE